MASSSQSKVCFFFKTQVSLQERSKLKMFVKAVFKKEKRKLQSLHYIFCNDKDLLEINRQYLRHDYYTDIITFEFSEKKAPVEGEVYISIDRVRDNAQKLGEPAFRELHRVMFHGVLHLCGYRDKSKEEKMKMRVNEELLLSNYFR
ncbi:MAG: rRNA maturation RNase YbeY [Chitinophagaceae bacterium]